MAPARVERIEAVQWPRLSASELPSPRIQLQVDDGQAPPRHCGRGRSSCKAPDAACVVLGGRFA
jgi:hypothetical protein